MTILIRTPVSESAVGSLNQYLAVIAASKTIGVTDGLTNTGIARADTDGNQQFLLSNEQVPAGATINSVTWSGELIAVGTPKYQPRFTINGELQSGTAVTAPNTLETRTEAKTVKDIGGLAFTVDDINAECFIRARNSSTSEGQSVHFSDLRLIIDYTEGANQAPVADDDTYSIQTDAQNNDVIATYVATDSDGTIANYSIDGAVLGIHATTGVISLLDNAGLVAGTPITATVTATDDDGASDTALITVNVTALALVIDSITAGPIYAGDSITINHSNASSSGKTYTINGQAISETSQDGATSVLPCPEPKSFGDRTLYYGVDLTIEITDGSDTDAVTFQIVPTVGDSYEETLALTGFNGPTYAPGLATADNGYCEVLTGTVTVDLVNGTATSDDGGSIRLWYQDEGDSIWSVPIDRAIPAGVVIDTTAPTIALNGDNPLEVIQDSAWSDPGATVSDNVDVNKQITADNTVDTSVIGQTTLLYNTTDAATNAAIQASRIVNVVVAPPIAISESTQNPFPASSFAIDTTYPLAQHIDNPDNTPLAYSVDTGVLPTGVTLNGSTGVLTKADGAVYAEVTGLIFDVVDA